MDGSESQVPDISVRCSSDSIAGTARLAARAIRRVASLRAEGEQKPTGAQSAFRTESPGATCKLLRRPGTSRGGTLQRAAKTERDCNVSWKTPSTPRMAPNVIQ